jgi:hypothetical protein
MSNNPKIKVEADVSALDKATANTGKGISGVAKAQREVTAELDKQTRLLERQVKAYKELQQSGARGTKFKDRHRQRGGCEARRREDVPVRWCAKARWHFDNWHSRAYSMRTYNPAIQIRRMCLGAVQ